MSSEVQRAIPLLLELVADIEQGRVVGMLAISTRIAGLAVDLFPVDALKDSLLPRDRKWADLAADIAEAGKINLEADEAEAAKVGP